MSVARWAHEIGGLALSLLGALPGWIFVAPVAALVPKRRDWIAVIGKQDGRFLDNSKFFYLQARMVAPELRIVWIGERDDVVATLQGGSCEAMQYPTLASLWFLLRCGTAVVDENAWLRHGRFYLLLRAAIVQLWHGVGFKRIGLERWRHETGAYGWASMPLLLAARQTLYRLTGRDARFAALACTSQFYRDQVFRPSFRAACFPIVGYPRNDFGLSLTGQYRDLAWSNVDAEIVGNLPCWRTQGRKLVLVAPTFRESGTVPMQLDGQTIADMDAFAEANHVEFVFKFHPFERNTDHLAGRHFHVCDRNSDIYPLFPHAAALVTDYSSISMDFLLVDKPLLFLIPNNDDYVQRDRQLQFDPRDMMPGPVVPDWPSLLAALPGEWACDSHAGERARLRSLAFDDLSQSGAVPELLRLMRAQGWITPGTTTN